jgi:hypothetical protein
MLLGQVLQKTLGADAHPTGEEALEMVLAQVHAPGNFL